MISARVFLEFDFLSFFLGGTISLFRFRSFQARGEVALDPSFPLKGERSPFFHVLSVGVLRHSPRIPFFI